MLMSVKAASLGLFVAIVEVWKLLVQLLGALQAICWMCAQSMWGHSSRAHTHTTIKMFQHLFALWWILSHTKCVESVCVSGPDMPPSHLLMNKRTDTIKQWDQTDRCICVCTPKDRQLRCKHWQRAEMKQRKACLSGSGFHNRALTAGCGQIRLFWVFFFWGNRKETILPWYSLDCPFFIGHLDNS